MTSYERGRRDASRKSWTTAERLRALRVIARGLALIAANPRDHAMNRIRIGEMYWLSRGGEGWIEAADGDPSDLGRGHVLRPAGCGNHFADTATEREGADMPLTDEELDAMLREHWNSFWPGTAEHRGWKRKDIRDAVRAVVLAERAATVVGREVEAFELERNITLDARNVSTSTSETPHSAPSEKPNASVAALRELVDCKDLKDARDRYLERCGGQCNTPEESQQYLALANDYARRLPLAWAAAREALRDAAPQPNASVAATVAALERAGEMFATMQDTAPQALPTALANRGCPSCGDRIGMHRHCVVCGWKESAALPTARAEPERKRFEEWLDETSGFDEHDEQIAWAAWQAAAPLQVEARPEPEFCADSVEQERLAHQFCLEIAGERGKRGHPPDPVRLLEMAEALYRADAAHVQVEARQGDRAIATPLPQAPTGDATMYEDLES